MAKDRERWRAIENEYAKTAAERSVNHVLPRQNPKLDEDEVANITQIKKKEDTPNYVEHIKAQVQKVERKGKTKFAIAAAASHGPGHQ